MGALTESLRSAVLDLRSMLGPWSSGDHRLTELLFGGRQVDAGVVVNETTALCYSALWCGVSLIANTLGAVPLHYYTITGADVRERDRDDPLDHLVSRDASDEMSAFFRGWYQKS